MNRLSENPQGKLRSVNGMMKETNLSRHTLMQIAEEANAILRYGKRGIRIHAERFYTFLEKEGRDA